MAGALRLRQDAGRGAALGIGIGRTGARHQRRLDGGRVQSGCCWRSRAATPLTCGVAVDLSRYFISIDQARDAILAENLRNMRATIDQFYGDSGRYPDSIEQLVEKKYLRALPVDPISRSNATRILAAPENGVKGNVYDIKSDALGTDRSGRRYAHW